MYPGKRRQLSFLHYSPFDFKNKLGWYLFLDIICSAKPTVFLDHFFRKTVLGTDNLFSRRMKDTASEILFTYYFQQRLTFCVSQLPWQHQRIPLLLLFPNNYTFVYCEASNLPRGPKVDALSLRDSVHTPCVMQSHHLCLEGQWWLWNPVESGHIAGGFSLQTTLELFGSYYPRCQLPLPIWEVSHKFFCEKPKRNSPQNLKWLETFHLWVVYISSFCKHFLTIIRFNRFGCALSTEYLPGLTVKKCFNTLCGENPFEKTTHFYNLSLRKNYL